ncbi:helix-turn-helix domain-containing protein [Psychromicrobium lacuslunae]|nr:helix-turn-helix transcriptional regulator [Psychromicrobium lacuslunae]
MRSTQESGWVLRELRQQAGLTLEEVAKLANTSASYLSRVENCKVQASEAYLSNASLKIVSQWKKDLDAASSSVAARAIS